ncbi:phage tail protein I [Paenibacillus alvei]|uniref:phage tail protein I n=1 Tax=Paenibacillus alvei TaxID=44250 RepID=UPI00227F8F7C|nr:phage tail protein I [Paenibacillus alvei]MCY7486426.1 phage tail protein I [Paenibacillus alvei]
MINIQQVNLLDILPSNLKSDPNIVAAAQAINTELRAVTEDIRKLSIYDRFNEWTDEETDELAWQYHVDFYDPALPLEQKRELVKNAIPWHRRKGTPSAVEELISTLFGEGKVEEWWEYGGQPFCFQVVTSNPEVTQERAQEFYRAVESVKRLSAKLEQVILSQTEKLQLYHGSAILVSENILIK